jgi:toxin FitB
MYLLDTNVISTLSPSTPEGSAETDPLRRWLSTTDAELYLSVVTVAEIQAGQAKAERIGATRKARAIAAWLEAIIGFYGDRILALDSVAARATGRLLDRAIGAGGDPGFEDAAVAAIAQQNGLIVLTRNVRHFRHFDVAFANPFENLPPL